MNRELPYRITSFIMRIVSIVLIVFAVLFALAIIYQRIFCPFHVVVSNSMSPQIKEGDAVVVKDVNPKEIRMGQVIVFADPEEKGKTIIHRVIGIEDVGYTKFFTTKGDNNPVPDPVKTASGGVVGGMAVRVPRFGSFLNYLSTPGGYISCVAIPGALAMLIVFIEALLEKLHGARARRRFYPQPTGF